MPVAYQGCDNCVSGTGGGRVAARAATPAVSRGRYREVGLQLLGVVAVPAADGVLLVPPLDVMGAHHPGHGGVGEPPCRGKHYPLAVSPQADALGQEGRASRQRGLCMTHITLGRSGAKRHIAALPRTVFDCRQAGERSVTSSQPAVNATLPGGRDLLLTLLCRL